MPEVQIISLRMVREREVPYNGSEIVGSAQAFTLFRDLLENLDRESFWVACLDTKANVTCLSQVSLGTLREAPVHPREVLKTALLANAASIIVAHNHPSGDPCPSWEDLILTTSLQKACLLLGIKLNDHLIIGNGAYYSFADEGKV